jgi:alanyl-tRNA synthetase
MLRRLTTKAWKPPGTPTAEIRGTFLEHFASRGHTVRDGIPLVPPAALGLGDLLFTNAGMNAFAPQFSLRSPNTHGASNLATVQRCVRAGGKHNDLDQVGRTSRHLTMFEMLGTFCLPGGGGDADTDALAAPYGRERAVWEAMSFLTGPLALPAERLSVTVLRGDTATHDAWRTALDDLGIGGDTVAISERGEDENWWSMGHGAGPCGPCTEIFWDRGAAFSDDRDERFLELWNVVLMDSYTDAAGKRSLLSSGVAIDTGMGLERIASVLQGVDSSFETDELAAVRAALDSLVPREHPRDAATELALRVITDHLRAAVCLIADGVVPGPSARGSVLRRLLRRSMRHAQVAGLPAPAYIRAGIDAVTAAVGAARAHPQLQQQLLQQQQQQQQRKQQQKQRKQQHGSNDVGDSATRVDLDDIPLVLDNVEPLLLPPDDLPRSHWTDIPRVAPAATRMIVDEAAAFGAMVTRATAVLERQLVRLGCGGGSGGSGGGGGDDDHHGREQGAAPGPDAAASVVVDAEFLVWLKGSFGMPISLAAELVRAKGAQADVDGARALMAEAALRDRRTTLASAAAAAAAAGATGTGVNEATALAEFDGSPTEYIGESVLEAGRDTDGPASVVTAVSSDGTLIAINPNPFYGRGGGQVGDRGTIDLGDGIERAVVDTLRNTVHASPVLKIDPAVGADHGLVPGVTTVAAARVDAERRRRTAVHHTATHIIHAALKSLYGPQVTQAGSRVGPESLRFDFTIPRYAVAGVYLYYFILFLLVNTAGPQGI